MRLTYCAPRNMKLYPYQNQPYSDILSQYILLIFTTNRGRAPPATVLSLAKLLNRPLAIHRRLPAWQGATAPREYRAKGGGGSPPACDGAGGALAPRTDVRAHRGHRATYGGHHAHAHLAAWLWTGEKGCVSPKKRSFDSDSKFSPEPCAALPGVERNAVRALSSLNSPVPGAWTAAPRTPRGACLAPPGSGRGAGRRAAASECWRGRARASRGRCSARALAPAQARSSTT